MRFEGQFKGAGASGGHRRHEHSIRTSLATSTQAWSPIGAFIHCSASRTYDPSHQHVSLNYVLIADGRGNSRPRDFCSTTPRFITSDRCEHQGATVGVYREIDRYRGRSDSFLFGNESSSLERATVICASSLPSL